MCAGDRSYLKSLAHLCVLPHAPMCVKRAYRRVYELLRAFTHSCLKTVGQVLKKCAYCQNNLFKVVCR